MSYYVYVIELDPVVMKSQRWRSENSEQSSDKCYYVGQSAHEPECRYNQHVTPRGSSCRCSCDFRFGQEVNPFQIGRARFAKNHSLRLCRDLYAHLNPLDSQSESIDAEKRLGESLRREGHGAWYR